VDITKVLEIGGAIYSFGKIAVDKLSPNYPEEDKIVNQKWLEISGKKEGFEKEGYSLRWSTLDRIEERKIKGWEVLYEVDQKAHINYRIVRVKNDNTVDSILIGIKRK